VHTASDSRTVSLSVCGNAKSMVDSVSSEGRFFEEPIVMTTRPFGRSLVLQSRLVSGCQNSTQVHSQFQCVSDQIYQDLMYSSSIKHNIVDFHGFD
jgi:hypothetical protein